MAQSEFNRKLINLGVSHNNIDINEVYATQSKSRTNSPLHRVGENKDNNMLSFQATINNQSDGALGFAANRTSLLSPTNNNPTGMNIS